MRVFYSLLIMLSAPLALLYFAFRGIRDRAYLGRWSERFGFFPGPVEKGGILVHAASVGEFNAASPLIKCLLRVYPDIPITVTTLTPTGSERVKRELGDKVSHGYIPIDLNGSVRRFLNTLEPSIIVVMETEIWPNLYLLAQERKTPLLMANARLSERSVRQFRRMSGLFERSLQSVNWIGAQSEEDANRLEMCGADRRRLAMTGNLKFDLNVPASLDEKGIALRARWGAARPVLVAGSTHEADEDVVIPAFASLLENLPNALLILVPRYPERFTRAAQSAKAAGLMTELHSEGEACSADAQCFVIDTIGELMTYYACGDVAFVGGSMGDQGGHNPLEPAALGKPVLLGPNMENAREIADSLINCDSARCITNQQEFRETAETILTNGTLRDSMGQAGRSLVDRNKGALDLTLTEIRKLVEP